MTDNPVIQADRDAAFRYMRTIQDHRWNHAAILNGGCDNTTVVKAFAEHRYNALEGIANPAAIPMLVEALRNIAKQNLSDEMVEQEIDRGE